MSTSILTKIQSLAAAAHTAAVAAATQVGMDAAIRHRAQVLRHAKSFAAETLGEQAAAPLVWEYVEDVDDDTEAADAWLDEYLALRVVYDHNAEQARLVLRRLCLACAGVREDDVADLPGLGLLLGPVVAEPSPRDGGAV